MCPVCYFCHGPTSIHGPEPNWFFSSLSRMNTEYPSLEKRPLKRLSDQQSWLFFLGWCLDHAPPLHGASSAAGTFPSTIWSHISECSLKTSWVYPVWGVVELTAASPSSCHPLALTCYIREYRLLLDLLNDF